MLINTKIVSNHKFVNYNYSIETYIEEAAYVYDLDPLLLKAIIKHESNFNPYAVSYKGAIGLMQLMPETIEFLKVRDPWDPRENIFAGARYYRMLLDRFNGDHYKALLAYHAGPEAVRKGRIPRESHKYATQVLMTWKKYRKGGVL
nr:lytic transglycosylase domain-containing protein [Thermosulfurimonas dismutans]